MMVMKKLSDVCRLINGRAYKKKEMLDSGPYPLLRVGNFFTNRNWYYSDLELHEDKYCDNGDLLYAWSASFGPRIWEGSKVIYHYHIWKIEINKVLVDKGYLFYLLDWDTEQIKKNQGAGTTMIHITKGSMEARVLPFPTLERQKNIVAKLNQAFTDIDKAKVNAERNLNNAKELFNNQLQKIFRSTNEGWRSTVLGELCEKMEYGSSSKSVVEGKIPVLRMGNIQNGKLDWEKLKYSNDADEIEKYSLNKGDVLFNRTNSAVHVGKSAIYDGKEPAIFAGYLIRIHRKEGLLDSSFLNYYLNSRFARDYGKTVMSQSVNQANINGTKLKQYPISVPSLDEQKLLVRKISALDSEVIKLTDIYINKLNAFDELKKSILQKAFNGELA